MAFNEIAFQESVADFAEFLNSGKLQTQERDYKEKLIKVLGEALTDEALASPDFLTSFRNALREVSNEAINLTYFMVFDDFKQYLNLVEQDRLVGMLRTLFDETIELSKRFDAFDAELHRDYDKYFASRKRSGWLTALLLTARFPQKCIFYRHRLIKFARMKFGYELVENGSRGQRYVAYLSLLESVREQLANAWDRSTDLIDAHSFLWVESARAKEDEPVKLTEFTPEKTRIWKIAPGPNAVHWKMCRDRKCIVVAFLDDLDFRKFPDTRAGRQGLSDAGQGPPNATAILRFTHRMKSGDIVVANKGVNTVVGIGKITSDYIEPKNPNNPSEDPEYRHARHVEWLVTEPMNFSKRLFIQQTVGRLSPDNWTSIKQAYLRENPDLAGVFAALEGNAPPELGQTIEPESPELRELITLASATRNIIVYGPPGTGKTYLVSEFAKHFLEPQLRISASPEERRTSDFREFVTFHQSFAYEEFIEGLKPSVSDEGELTYEVRPGVFKDIAARATAAWRKHGDSSPKYLIVIDEINRANIAKVFGELITLIEDDKRLGEGNELELRLPYSGDKFGVPPNLYIVGTMNTADRSIALLDLALRRRFSFLEVTPNSSLLKSVAGINLGEVLKKLNEKIELLLDRDHRIGHSYLMKAKTSSDLHFAWYRRVLPLLQEYFYNDNERLYALLGDGFMRRTEIGDLSPELSELVDTDSPRYEIRSLSEDELLHALAQYQN